jgi:hypothetical protein
VTIERLNDVLEAIGAPASTRELTEILWLACHITPQEAESSSSPGDPEMVAGSRPHGKRGSTSEQASTGSPAKAEPTPATAGQTLGGEDDKAGIFPRAAAGGRGRNVGSVLVPTAPMLSGVLDIERALRPLKRQVPSEHLTQLDEDATAARIADQPAHSRRWIPVMRKSAERWMSLAFVIDTGPSMQVWRSLAEELQDIFVRLAAFRDPRTWYLRGGDISATPDGLPQNPAALIRPSSRQVVLILSDCSGAHWWDGQAPRALRLWARQTATAVLQPLSERLWRRTSMPPIPGLAYLMTAGAPNSELVFSPYDTAPGTGVPVPVLEISQTWLADWARLLCGPSSSPLPMAVSYVPVRVLSAAKPLERERQLSIAERVRRFQNTASPEAARLAACLAVSFPSLPVLRLLQHQLLDSRQPAHLAEVLLSGLLRAVDEKQQTFEFVTGAREALLASMPRSESWYVADALSRISAEIEALADKTRESFQAFLQVPKGAGYNSLETDQPIALVSPEAVRYLRRSLVSVQPREQPQTQEPATTESSPARILPQSPPFSADVSVSYAPQDRPWAEWIEAILAGAGLRVLRSSTVSTVNEQMKAVESAPLFIAVLSRAFITSPAALSVWDAAVAGLERTQRRLLPIHVSESRLTGQFADFSPLDLGRLDHDQAAAALQQAVERAGRPIVRPSSSDTGKPRFPPVIPPVWNVPTRNPAFTERDTIMERLRDAFTGGSSVLLPQALYGLGGIGKTQIALEYAHRFMSSYDAVWWVPAESSELIAATLAELGVRLGIRVRESVTEAATYACDALRRGSPYADWLLIFDGADDPRDLEPFLPGGSGHVLITSSNPVWDRMAVPLEVAVFTRAQSIDYLQHRVPELPEADADQVAAALGDLPLAVAQAGSWLAETGMPAATYMEQLRTAGARLLETDLPDYPRSASQIWRTSFDRLRHKSPAAARLLEICAYCAPVISMQLLYSDEVIRALLPFDNRLRERVVLSQIIRDIARFGLAKVDQDNNDVEVHRLVQASIRDWMQTKQYREDTCHIVHSILVGTRPRQGDTDNPENWPRFDLIWPHLTPSEAAECIEEDTRQLLMDRLRYLWKRGELELALRFGKDLAELWTVQFGQDERQVLYLRFHIANVLRSLGRYSEARQEDSDILTRQREVLVDHPHILMTTGGLAADLRGLGEYLEPLELDRQTYDGLSERYGEEHSWTLSAANNLAVGRRLTGDFQKAFQLDRENLRRRQAVLGPDHPYTLHSAANLARDMRHLGSYAESVELLRATYERYLAVLGEDLVESLRTATSLAVSLRKYGDFEAARRLTSETRERYQRSYPPDFPEAYACTLNLACDLSAQGDNVAARDLARTVMQTYEQNLGPDHPHTLLAANNVATYLRRSGGLPEARTLAERALQGFRAKLGDSHPHSLSSAVNLANCLSDLGETGQAEELGAETRARLSETLGAQHPDTLICAANLAVSLRISGNDDQARDLQEQVLSSMVSVVGNDHFAARALRQWRRQDIELEQEPL